MYKLGTKITYTLDGTVSKRYKEYFLSNFRPATHCGSKNDEESILFAIKITLDPVCVSLFILCKFWYLFVIWKIFVFAFIRKDIYPLVLLVTDWFLGSRKIHLILCIFLTTVFCSNSGFFNEPTWSFSNNFIDNPGCKTYVQGHWYLHGRFGEKKWSTIHKERWSSAQKTMRLLTYRTWRRKCLNTPIDVFSEKVTVLFWSFPKHLKAIIYRQIVTHDTILWDSSHCLKPRHHKSKGCFLMNPTLNEQIKRPRFLFTVLSTLF